MANTALFQIATHAPTTLPALFKAVPRLSGPARQHVDALVDAVMGAVEKSRREQAEWARYVEGEEERTKKEEKERKERELEMREMIADVGEVGPVGADLWSKLGSEQKGM
jgi:hypothetical protein